MSPWPMDIPDKHVDHHARIRMVAFPVDFTYQHPGLPFIKGCTYIMQHGMYIYVMRTPSILFLEESLVCHLNFM